MRKILLITLLSTTFVLLAQSPELEKAKQFYRQPKDSLKRKALLFLIDNLDIHYSETYYWADEQGQRVDFNEFDYPTYAESEKALNELKKQQKLHTVAVRIPDREQIAAEQLRQSVETAFENWKKPWNRSLSFDDLCDYLLPYRIQNELLEDWRKPFRQLLPKETFADAVKYTQAINQRLSSFNNSFSYERRSAGQAHLSPRQMLYRWQGHCQDMCHLSVLTMRLGGLPVTVDFTPYWATSSSGHLWCSLIKPGNRPSLPFEGGKGGIGEFTVKREPSKVFRITYRRHSSALASQLDTSLIPDGTLRMANIIDVTSLYWRTVDLKTNLRLLPSSGVAFVAVFNGLKWRPVYWGSSSGSSVLFRNLCVGAIYLPMNYERGRLIPSGSPVLLRNDRSQTRLSVDSKGMTDLTIPERSGYLFFQPGKSYRLFCWENNRWRLLGQQRASYAKSIQFDKIPAQRLYLLIPEYSRGKERPFTLTDRGEIEYW